MLTSIIIPAFNESNNLKKLIDNIKSNLPNADIIIIDDGSDDQMFENMVFEQTKVIRHPINLGNGAAIKSGIRNAKCEILMFMDADGQHDTADLSTLLEHIEQYDMVVGARNRNQQASLARGLMNSIFNRLASYVTGHHVEDLTSGFRAMRAETARALLPLLPNGYSWTTTSTLVLLRSGLSIKYVPINVRPRQHGRSRIRPIRDGIRFLLIITKICTLYSPFRIFLPVSGMMFMMGLINYAYTYFTEARFTNMSALMFTTSVVIFMMGLISEQISQISLLRQQVGHRETDKDNNKKDNKTDGTGPHVSG